MRTRPWYRSKGPAVGPSGDPHADEPLADVLPITMQRADCCVADAAYRVVLPASEQRSRPTELLLCGHHLRAAQAALSRSNASVYDARGRLVALAAQRAGR